MSLAYSTNCKLWESAKLLVYSCRVELHSVAANIRMMGPMNKIWFPAPGQSGQCTHTTHPPNVMCHCVMCAAVHRGTQAGHLVKLIVNRAQ